ncbi:MAG: dihydroorotate dehydrogenase [Thermodesulfobacteriota bacterium]|nr:dihydroorotate dehydrogenase [Thermodesulfobacteriota bacterium]
MGIAIDLSTNLGDLKLKNPVLVASGTGGYGVECSRLYDLNLLGGIVVKGLSVESQKGNLPPRIVETACGMLNAIGLENIGISAFLGDKLPLLRRFETKIIANFFGYTIEEYVKAAKMLGNIDGIDALEMNISCPNIKKGGMLFGIDPETAFFVTQRVRENVRVPLIVKLPPLLYRFKEVTDAVINGGAEILSLMNTVPAMAIDIKKRRPKLGNITGGLSGPSIKPIALRLIYHVAKEIDIPIIGVGGIMNGSDALEHIMAGASAIAVGTANFVNPLSPLKVLDEMKEFLAEEKIKSIKEIVGIAIVQENMKVM